MTRYRKYYPGDSWEKVWDEIPMIEGIAYIAGAMTHDGWLQFSQVSLKGGYLKDEVERMLKNQ